MKIDALGHVVVRVRDLAVSKSLYVRDPDQNLVELYINATDAWRQDPAIILSEGGALPL